MDAEISTLNNAETQAVQIISENPWRLYHAGVLTLRDNKGERVANPHCEPVLTIREFFHDVNVTIGRLGSSGHYSPHLGKISPCRTAWHLAICLAHA